MSIPGKNADLYRRLRLYALGFVLGLFVVSFVYKGRGCKMPSSAKLDELNYQKLEFTSVGECKLTCNNITKAELKELLKNGKVNYDESDVHKKPFATYAIERASRKSSRNFRIIIEDVDTISRVLNYIDLNATKDTCKCE